MNAKRFSVRNKNLYQLNGVIKQQTTKHRRVQKLRKEIKIKNKNLFLLFT